MVDKATLSLLLQLQIGENGTRQPSRVKRRLRELERSGLIRWVQTPGCNSCGGGGWYLTEDGRAAVAPAMGGN